MGTLCILQCIKHESLAWPHYFTYKGGLGPKVSLLPHFFYWGTCTQEEEWCTCVRDIDFASDS